MACKNNVEGGGLSLDARLAIANVVINRKESPRFQTVFMMLFLIADIVFSFHLHTKRVLKS